MALAVTLLGNPSLPPLFCIHGFAAHAQVWKPLANALEGRFCLHAVDLPGCGQSAPGSYAPQDLLPALARVAPARSVWLGWSLGGMLAQAMAAQQPERVSVVVSVAASLKFVADATWPQGVPATVYQGFLDLVDDVPALLRRFASLQLLGETQHMRQHLKWLQQHVLQPQPTADTLRAGLDLLNHLDLRNTTPALTMPVWHLLSDQDAVLPSACAGDIARLCPGQTVHMLQGASHASPVTQAEPMATLLTECLGRQP